MEDQTSLKNSEKLEDKASSDDSTKTPELSCKSDKRISPYVSPASLPSIPSESSPYFVGSGNLGREDYYRKLGSQ